MKKPRVIAVTALLIFMSLSLIATAQDSRAIYFNGGWKFYKGDTTGAEQTEFNDGNWRRVTLPHDWSVEGPFSKEWASGTGYLPGGVGWYRKSFLVDKAHAGKQIYVYFDGVYKNSEVWVNGKYLGKRPNGYASFFYDMTPYLHKEKNNIIAVKVDHTDFADSRWYTGSGINRNVYIIPVNPTHVDIWGVAFSTPKVTQDKADVRIDLNVQNANNKIKQVEAVAQILSAANDVVATSKINVNLKGEVSSAQFAFSVDKPKLWSPATPNLYKLKITLRANGEVVDTVQEQVGFRSFSFDANKGFTLNGENFKLKGVCFHDDAGALGSAVPRSVWENRLRILKELGCNAIRMSHNPHQDYMYDLCDRLGFIVQDEAFDEWEAGKNKWIEGWNVGKPGNDGYSKYFNEWADIDIKDMILRNRNRASILMWSIGNEIDYPNDPYTHEVLSTGRNPQIYGRGYQHGNPPAKRLAEIAKRLVSAVKKYDTTRPVTAALAGVVMSNTTTYPRELDVVGYNYQEYRYKDDHKEYPDRVIYGSENSKSYDAWKAVTENDFIAGQFLWTAFDFLGEARAWPMRSSGAGLIDMAGFPKPEFYHRQSLWSEKAVLALASSRIDQTAESQRRYADMQQHWNWNNGDSVRVFCYTNLEEVELFLNGRSMGRKKLLDSQDKIVRWRFIYEPGELVAKAYMNDAVQEVTLQSSGTPSKIIATADKKWISVNPDEVVEIEIVVADNYGRVVGNATDELSVEVQGSGRLIGLESGSLSSHEDYKGKTRAAVSGKLKAYVQATGRGAIEINVTGANLTPGRTDVVVK